MAIDKIFAPLVGGEGDAVTLSLAGEMAMHFHAHVEVASATVGRAESIEAAGRGWPSDEDDSSGPGETGPGPRALFEQWRRQYHLQLQPECRHRGLASTSWLTLEDWSETRLAHRAKFADLVCIANKPGEIHPRGARALHAILFSSGRPVLLQPVREGMTRTSVLGEPITIGWNGSVEAVHAVAAALALIQRSRRVEIISIGEKSVNAFDAYELAKYLAWSGVRAVASGIALEDWTGGDVVDAAVDRGAKLLVMGARHGGNATAHMLGNLPVAALMAA